MSTNQSQCLLIPIMNNTSEAKISYRLHKYQRGKSTYFTHFTQDVYGENKLIVGNNRKINEGFLLIERKI